MSDHSMPREAFERAVQDFKDCFKISGTTAIGNPLQTFDFADLAALVATVPKDPSQDQIRIVHTFYGLSEGDMVYGFAITLSTFDEAKGNYPYIAPSTPSHRLDSGSFIPVHTSVWKPLDTALRRRFEFQEVMPDPEVIKEHAPDGGQVGDFNITDILKVINERIEVLVDRDHTIGHSYFLECDSMASLQKVFEKKVIPLLQEYFYGDYGKIGLVLGEGFVRPRPKNNNLFPKFSYEGRSELNHSGYELIPSEEWVFEEALEQLLQVDQGA